MGVGERPGPIELGLQEGDLRIDDVGVRGDSGGEAIGDDALMQGAGQAVRPESFTHGSSQQRMEALRRGLQSGNPSVCNYNRV